MRPNVLFRGVRYTFKVPDKRREKNYDKAVSHSPDILTTQCVRRNPWILRVSDMKCNESAATMISALSSRFPTPPVHCFYDNMCNTMQFLLLRFPSVTAQTRLFCDRFHYRTHIFPAAFDPDSYPFAII